MDPQQAQAQAMHMMMVMLPMFFVFWAVMMAIVIIPLWNISKKAGLSGPLSLLALIPGIGILVVLYVVAFSQWKVVPAASAVAYPASYPPTNYPPPPTTL